MKQVKSELNQLLTALAPRKPKTILEIGTGRGETTLAFANAFPKARLITLDNNGFFGGGYSDAEALVLRKKMPHVLFLRRDSHEKQTIKEVQLLAQKPIDFLFIDGDHSYAGVNRDFYNYFPLMAKKGVVAFHDIAKHDEVLQVGRRVLGRPLCEVQRFWNQIKHEFKHEEFVENPRQGWAGIGVLWL